MTIENTLKTLTDLFTLEISLENLTEVRVDVVYADDEGEEVEGVIVSMPKNDWIEDLRISDRKAEREFGMDAFDLAAFLKDFGAHVMGV